jgi:hypothetical protein
MARNVRQRTVRARDVIRRTIVIHAGPDDSDGLGWDRNMPVYYCHQHTGDGFIPDEEGREHPSFEAAHSAAIAGARDLMCSQVHTGRLSLDESLELHDAAGTHLATIRFADVLRIVPRRPDRSVNER